MLKLAHVIVKNGDAHFTVPTLDFIFKVVIPKANKERLIMERDMMGRILSSKVPQPYYRYETKQN